MTIDCITLTNFIGIGLEDTRVREALIRLRLEKYLVVFKRHEIDYETFLTLNDEQLNRLGIPIGPQIKIKQEIQQTKENGKMIGEKILNIPFFKFDK